MFSLSCFNNTFQDHQPPTSLPSPPADIQWSARILSNLRFNDHSDPSYLFLTQNVKITLNILDFQVQTNWISQSILGRQHWWKTNQLDGCEIFMSFILTLKKAPLKIHRETCWNFWNLVEKEGESCLNNDMRSLGRLVLTTIIKITSCSECSVLKCGKSALDSGVSSATLRRRIISQGLLSLFMTWAVLTTAGVPSSSPPPPASNYWTDESVRSQVTQSRPHTETGEDRDLTIPTSVSASL